LTCTFVYLSGENRHIVYFLDITLIEKIKIINKYLAVKTVLKSNRKIDETETKWITLTHIYITADFLIFPTYTSIKYRLRGYTSCLGSNLYLREYRRGDQKRTIQRNWKHRVHKTKNKAKQKHNTICVGDHDTETNTKNINKT